MSNLFLFHSKIHTLLLEKTKELQDRPLTLHLMFGVDLLCQVPTKTQKHNTLFLLHEFLARPSHANDEHEGDGSLTSKLHSQWWTQYKV